VRLERHQSPNHPSYRIGRVPTLVLRKNINMTTLVVEPDPDYAIIISEVFRYLGQDVAVASTSRSARQFSLRGNIDMAVVDVTLPDGTGLELCNWFREFSPKLPLMLLSQTSRRSDVVAGFNAGVDDVIAKPFHPEELLVRIRALRTRSNL